MVFIELIQVQSAGSDWELKKSAAQLVRLLWVSYLVYGNTPLNGLRASLLAVCAYSITFEILTGVASCKAKDSYSIGKNAKLIQNYMKELDDLTTTPLDKCDYIVMGEENHEIDICENGCNLGRIKSNSEGKLTIGRVFQHNSSEDETCTLAHPDWRDTCLSLALSKMLMRRFVNLPLNEVGSRKALEFVREGLVGYIGCNEDIPLERRNGARNPADRVFCIIQNELRIFFSKAPTTEVNKAILNSLKTKFERGGQLTNGETALKRHGIWEHLDFVYRPNTSITEAILVWHIATTLFHLKSPPEKKNDVFEKDRKVALTLSRYCHYLVAFLPELLPDEVEWVKNLYKGVREEISVIGRSSGQETQDPRRRNHYNYMMGEEVTWNEKPVLEKGAKLAKMLLELAASSYDMEGQAGNGTKVWTMLSEFWVEMLLFMAPSDNVKGHEEILENNELITQLWALLTHAGILTRSQFIPPPNCETERNEVTQDRSTNTQHPDNGSESNEITEE
ncbi:hypothetical protein LUZ62_023455 [Rhynchospora pubera]|uniref:DUF4220 domain-containing protein n=1 Tax=Rhynchospora pubera TaxID=906938 RepID=A0AAV8GZD0_9POAL|nr:hypothetical protein LUZ62_000315 [Rhynchospora pubera]KAJ4810889.1 hypothetical protein LUZ62_023455 [Rhynchospora pubera]